MSDAPIIYTSHGTLKRYHYLVDGETLCNQGPYGPDSPNGIVATESDAEGMVLCSDCHHIRHERTVEELTDDVRAAVGLEPKGKTTLTKAELRTIEEALEMQ